MELLLRIFETSAITIGVPLVLYLLARLFPFKPQKLSGQPVDFKELQRKYVKWELAGLIPFFAFSAIGGYLTFQGLVWIFHHSLPQSGENRYLMLPHEYIFGLPAFFSGIFLGAIPIDLIYRFLLKEKYAEATLYSNLKSGFDGMKVLKFLAVIILVPSVVFTCLAMDSYARFTDRQMITNRFWGLGETVHPYDQISRIKSVRLITAPNGNIVENPYHVIHFSDGSIWSTRGNVYRAAGPDQTSSSEKEKEIFNFVTAKAGKEVERFDFLDRQEED